MTPVPQRVLIVALQLREFVPQRGDLFRALQAAGHEVTLLADPTGTTDVPTEIADRLVPWTVRNHSKRAGDLRAQVAQVMAVARRVRPDVVHTVHYRAAIIGGLATRRLRLPMLAEFGGVGSAIAQRPLVRAAVQRVARFALSGQRPVIGMVQASAQAATLAYTGVQEWVQVPGAGIALPDGPALATDGRVLYVGRFVATKGINTFLELAAAAAPGPTWTAVGSVDERDPDALDLAAVEAAALEAGVELTGQLPPVEVRELMRTADVLVLPSSHPEGVPRVVIEALAGGTPVVTSMAGGMATIEAELGIANRLPWLRLPDLATDRWLDAITSALSPPDRDGLRREAHALARTHFDVAAHAAAVGEAYARLRGTSG